MSRFRFDGRVVVVTGAGRGLGRAYARFLAAAGARVVVNDVGSTTTGTGHDPRPAEIVVEEIARSGGSAVADASDVSTVAGGVALITRALDAFGRIDAVINNAGIIIPGGLPEVELANIDSHVGVHVKGTFNVIRAAWPHMLEQNYGRVVLTGSTAMFGLPDNVGYATAKSSMIGMANSLTASAGERDIKINVIMPNAVTRMVVDSAEEGSAAVPRDADTPAAPSLFDPEQAAPLAAYLAHDLCPARGGLYVAGGGRFARIFIAATTGYQNPDFSVASIEDIADNWPTIESEATYFIPASLASWSSRFFGREG